jgi:hypothetical protein
MTWPVISIGRGSEVALQQIRASITGICKIGGAEGDRTPDLMNAIHALSQLSYGPIFWFRLIRPM